MLFRSASWNFIIWGGYHGALLSLERMTGVGAEPKSNFLLAGLRVVFTFALVTVGWVFFRAETFHDAQFVLSQLVSTTLGTFPLSAWLCGTAIGTLLLAIVEERYQIFDRLSRAGMWTFATTMGLLLIVLELFSVTDVAIPFVYFQF